MVTRSYMSRREVEQQSFSLPVALFVPLGAILVQFPFKVVLKAFLSLATIFFVPKADPMGIIKEIVLIAHKTRKEGIVSLDRDLDKI